jgi:trigger factor
MTAENETPASDSPFRLVVEEPEVWKRVIKVEVDRDHFEKEYAARLRRAARNYTKPGFRRGKTPRATVERELGDQLRAQTLEHVVPQAFKSAIVEHRLVPITDPVLEHLVFEPDRPVSFDLVIEVRPQVVAENYNDLPLRRRPPRVEDAEVDAVLERLRESRAVFEKVARPGRDGDRLTVDLTPLGDDGEPQAERRIPGQQLELGAESNFDAFNERLAGLAAGEGADIAIAYPDDHHAEHLRGVEVTYRCEVQTVEEKVVPELDDAFAARVREGETLLELRAEIRSDLEKEEEHRVQRELEEQIVDLLVERHDLAVPPSLITQYLDSSVEEMRARSAQYGRATSDEDITRFREGTRPVAERVMKGMFIMEAIRRQEGLTVSEQDVDARIEEIAREHGFDLEKYREFAARGGERDRIRHAVEERKTFDFLLSRAQIAEAEPDANE